MEKYKKALLNSASRLDDITKSYGEVIKLAISIAEDGNDSAARTLLKRILEVIDNSNYTKEEKKIAGFVKVHLVEYYGQVALRNICKADTKMTEDTRTLEELLAELNNLIGLQSVKEIVRDLIAYQKIQQLRKKNNLYSVSNTLHLAFVGNPGTGKTTVARIVGYIYKKIGLLSKGHFMEVSRTDLIAGYQGQTALKVKKVIEKAKGGVLFIDEAYSITENEQSDSYGRECLTELTKALEDYRDDLVVIVAGYTEPMRKFFDANPGLKSRFNTVIEFPDYNVNELKKIFLVICDKNNYILEEKAFLAADAFFEKIVSEKGEIFANGRSVRNLFDKLVMNHARRVANIKEPTEKELITITVADFQNL